VSLSPIVCGCASWSSLHLALPVRIVCRARAENLAGVSQAPAWERAPPNTLGDLPSGYRATEVTATRAPSHHPLRGYPARTPESTQVDLAPSFPSPRSPGGATL